MHYDYKNIPNIIQIPTIYTQCSSISLGDIYLEPEGELCNQFKQTVS